MQLRMIAAFAVCLFACNTSETTAPAADTTATRTSGASFNTYGYDIGYESNFEIGDNANKEKVLAIYKAWDGNTLDDVRNYMDDSLHMYLWDGSSINNTADSAMSEVKKYRAMFSNLSSEVHAVVSVRATDKNEDWVFIWAKEKRTDDKGKVDSTELQEAWMLKNGKINTLYQYAQGNMPGN